MTFQRGPEENGEGVWERYVRGDALRLQPFPPSHVRTLSFVKFPSGPGSEMEDGGVQLSEVCCVCFNKVTDDRHQGLTNHLKFTSYQFKPNKPTSMHSMRTQYEGT